MDMGIGLFHLLYLTYQFEGYETTRLTGAEFSFRKYFTPYMCSVQRRLITQCYVIPSSRAQIVAEKTDMSFH